jgi:flagellar protein FlaF
MSLQAYQKTIQTTEDPRNMEYRLFAEITSDLMAAAERGIRDKQMVRASFISLSLFVMKFSGAVLRDGEDIQALIDINRTIMQGLKPQEGTPGQAVPPTPAP